MTALVLALALAAGSLVEEGRALYNANRFAEARNVLEKAVRTNPADPAARFWLACVHMALGDLETALRRFEPLNAQLGRDPEYLYAVSETYTRAARQLVNKLVAAGESARAHQHLAHRYLNTGDWKTAVDELRVAAMVRSNVPGIHLEAAQLLWEQKQHDEAAKELQAELAIAPRSFLANLRYGQYLLRQKRFSEAAGPLEIAVRHQKMPEAVLLQALNFLEKHQPDRALAAIAAGLAVFPKDSDLLGMRGQIVAKNPGVRQADVPALSPLTEPAPSAAALRAALDRNPHDEDALYLLSDLYSERGAEFFERLENIAPDSVRVFQVRGLNAETVGDLKEAEACYRKVIEKQPRLAGAHYALGHLLRRSGRDADARTEFEREMEIDPNHHLAHFELGAIHLANGDAQAALPMLEKAVSLRPALPDPNVELAKAYIQLKRPAEAIPLLKTAIRIEAEHPTAHYLLSRACLMTGAAEEGRREVAIHQEIVRKQARLRRSMAQRQQDENAKAEK